MNLTEGQRRYLLRLVTAQLELEMSYRGKADPRQEGERVDTYSLQMGIETLGRLIDGVDWAIDDQELMDIKDVLYLRTLQKDYRDNAYEVILNKELDSLMEKELEVRGY